jgi:hypothetical protein
MKQKKRKRSERLISDCCEKSGEARKEVMEKNFENSDENKAHMTDHKQTVQYSTIKNTHIPTHTHIHAHPPSLKHTHTHTPSLRHTHTHTHTHAHVPYPADVLEGKKGEDACTDTGTGQRDFNISEYCCRHVLNSLQSDKKVWGRGE